jgi:hypothetical protein
VDDGLVEVVADVGGEGARRDRRGDERGVGGAGGQAGENLVFLPGPAVAAR